MPYSWWNRKNLVLAAAIVALAFIGFVVVRQVRGSDPQ